MTKRRVSAAVVVGISVLALSGCGSKSASPSTGGGAGTQPPTTAAPPTTSGGGGGYSY